jgi:type IV secretory pathway VirB3-like protein
MATDGYRHNRVYKAMNRPLTVLGAERRLFFVALITGGAVFTLMHSFVGGILLFVAGVIVARIATKHDVEILRVLFNSGKFRRRYDPMKPLRGADALTCVQWPSRSTPAHSNHAPGTPVWSGDGYDDSQIRIVRRDGQN